VLVQILFVVIHMVYQEKTRVPGRTVRETRCLGVTWAQREIGKPTCRPSVHCPTLKDWVKGQLISHFDPKHVGYFSRFETQWAPAGGLPLGSPLRRAVAI